MAITDIDDYIAKTTDANADIIKGYYSPALAFGTAVLATSTANVWQDLFQFNHIPDTGQPNGTTARQCTLSTVGALHFTNPSGGRKKYITGIQVVPHSNFAGLLVLYDRILDVSGLSGTGAGAQTVGGTFPRYTTDAESRGNLIVPCVWDSNIGATATTITASYTKEDGTTSGRTTKAAVIGGAGNQERTRCFPLCLQDTDLGVRAVASITLAASTLTAGNLGCFVAHPLAAIRIDQATTASVPMLFKRGCMPEIKTDACLSFMFLSAGTTPPDFTVFIGTIEST